MNLRAVSFLLFAAVVGLVAYRVGYSSGQSEARIPDTRTERQAEDAAVEQPSTLDDDPALAQLELEASSCRLAMGWFASELILAEAMAERVKDALLRGDEAAAEDDWNSYYQGRALDEYYQRDFREDAALCGLPKRYLRRL